MTADDTLRENSGLVYREAHRFRSYTRGTSIDFDDIVQVGFLGMIKGMRRFDSSRGLALSTYLVPTIRGEILRYLRENIGGMRFPRSMKYREKMQVAARSLHETVYQDEGEPIERIHTIPCYDDHTEFEMNDLLDRTLDERKKKVVDLRAAGKTQKEIGTELGLTQVHISRELTKIKKQLQEAMMA